jgi:hypothetical protein
MKQELCEELWSRYPKMFAGTEKVVCACGDGWFDLIDTLCERLQHWTDHNGAPQLELVQIKEKMGTLRFYLRQKASPEQQGMIWMAEAMSARLCETCGKPGQTLVHQFCLQTRCAEHAPEGAILKSEVERFNNQSRPQ